MMKRIKYIIAFASVILAAGACTKENIDTGGQGGGDAGINLKGSATRNAPGYGIYLRAFYDDSGEVGDLYIDKSEMKVKPDGGFHLLKPGEEKEFYSVDAKPYYPFRDTTVRLFAYSGRLSTVASRPNDMVLVAGSNETNDLVLSNYGRAFMDGTPLEPNIAYEGKGTPGSSKSPARTLHFRHVMTKLTVEVKDYAADPPTVTPTLKELKLESVGVGGYYSLMAKAPDITKSKDELLAANMLATFYDPTLYVLKTGVNYLVPVGADIARKGKIKSLKLDDYVATTADLENLEIVALGEDPDGNLTTESRLLPGYAYKLTITVGRLGILGITLKQEDWIPKEIESEVDYEPNLVWLNLGNYDAVSETAVKSHNNIERLVLYTSDKEMKDTSGREIYIVQDGSGEMRFVDDDSLVPLDVKMPSIPGTVRQYIGEGSIDKYPYADDPKYGEDMPKMRFVTYPNETDLNVLTSRFLVDSVSIYTHGGLLITYPVIRVFNPATRTIALPLSCAGMRLQDWTDPCDLVNNTEDNPFLVQTMMHMINLQKDIDAAGTEPRYFKQTNDIDLDAMNLMEPEYRFKGLSELYGGYDGNYKYIAGIDAQANGLCEINYGVIKNIHMLTGVFNAGDEGSLSEVYAGSICAINKGVVIGCINETRMNGEAISGNSVIGGICGLNEGWVIGCLNTGNIHYGKIIGGIVGHNAAVFGPAGESGPKNLRKGAVAACINVGDISFYENDGAFTIDLAGGIVGECDIPDDPTAVDAFRNNYWLVGTAQAAPGEASSAIGTPEANIYAIECAALDPTEMRNGVVIKLNDELDDLQSDPDTPRAWSGLYKFELERFMQSTWPAPVMK